jgi:hypothetical protein
MRRFRNIFRFLAPSWLTEGEGELVLFSLGLIKDAFVERMDQGVNGRFPTRSSSTALALTGKDRGIIQGRTETNEHYATRLVAWRFPRGHRVRGSAFAVLEQISEYFGGTRVASIDVTGNYYEREADGTELPKDPTNTWNWDSTGKAPNWARFWVLFYPVPEVDTAEWPDFGDPLLWGGQLCVAGTTIGQTNISEEDTKSIRRLFRKPTSWKPSGTRSEWLILAFDGVRPVPDATWLDWSEIVAGVQVRTRSADHRYWSLSPAINNTFEGRLANYCTSATLPDGTTDTGDLASYPTSTVLPDGSTFAGDEDNYPASVQLVDDGDLPS